MSRDILTLLAFIFGSIIGSFLNVLIFRLPRNMSVISPPSSCPHCGYRIHPWENIPILGYFIVRGKCRSCGQTLSLQYPVVEFMSGLIAALVIWNAGLHWNTVAVIVLVYLLGVATVIDFRHQIIPDAITLSGIILGIIFSAFHYPGLTGILKAVLGILAGGGVLYAIALFGNFLFKKESMGGGDIKLVAMFGAFLGWKLTLIGVFLGFCIGALFGGVYLLTAPRQPAQTEGGENSQEETKSVNEEMATGNVLPFGPSLAAGAIISLLWGNNLLEWYLSSFM